MHYDEREWEEYERKQRDDEPPEGYRWGFFLIMLCAILVGMASLFYWP